MDGLFTFCQSCKKKYINIKIIECKCKLKVCLSCKLSHSCTFDYHADQKEKLAKHLKKLPDKRINLI